MNIHRDRQTHTKRMTSCFTFPQVSVSGPRDRMREKDAKISLVSISEKLGEIQKTTPDGTLGPVE